MARTVITIARQIGSGGEEVASELATAMGGPEIPPTQVPPDLPQDVAKRLLEAWRGEIEARAVYEALADREKDERRAAVLRKMASGEKGHLERVEARMRQLGIPIPDPATVRLSPWPAVPFRLICTRG